MANFFHFSLNTVLWFFRIAVIVVPIIAYFITYQSAARCRACAGIGKRKRAVVVHLSADGEYTTTPTPPRPDDVHGELEPEPVPVRIDIEPLVAGGVELPEQSGTGVRQVTR